MEAIEVVHGFDVTTGEGKMLNWKMLSHPMNWVVVTVMLVIAGIFGHLLMSLLDHEPTTNATVGPTPQGLASASSISGGK